MDEGAAGAAERHAAKPRACGEDHGARPVAPTNSVCCQKGFAKILLSLCSLSLVTLHGVQDATAIVVLKQDENSILIRNYSAIKEQ